MSRFLIVVPPLVGHTNPAVSVARALQDDGHEVAWVAYPEVVGHLLPPDAVVYPAGSRGRPSLATRDAQRGLEAIKFLWESFIVPVARDMAPAVSAAVADFAPDLVVSDQQAVAGAIVAVREGVPWVSSATTSAEIVNPMGAVPKLVEWVDGLLAGLERELGLPEELVGSFDPRFSPLTTLVFSTEALAGAPLVDHPVSFVGPAFAGRPVADDGFPWPWLDRFERVVLISLGTESSDVGERFLRLAIEAVADQPYGAVVVGPPALAEGAPDNVLVRARVPQVPLMARLAAVVSHGGHNTVCEALAHGLPLVAVPIRDDQPIVASQVVAAGAGVRIKFQRSRADDIRKAIEAVLGDVTHRDAAAHIAQTFTEAGGAISSSHLLSGLVAGNNGLGEEGSCC